jgi:hypothetical protein
MATQAIGRFSCPILGTGIGSSSATKTVSATWTLSSPVLFEVQVTIIATTSVVWGSSVASQGTLCIIIPAPDNVYPLRIDNAGGRKVTTRIPIILGVEGDTQVSLRVAGLVEVPVTVLVI